ncbi:glycosyltransferase family 2 protein [Escherichia coli]|nr:glycosyltransferase family 2 protein [Escherichia coli]
MIYISIVSHNHGNVILQLGCVKKLSKKYNVIITDNTGEVYLEKFCKSNGVWYIKNAERKGFGENNNQNFQFVRNKLSMRDDDYFLVLNPDVYIEDKELEQALSLIMKEKIKASTINLMKEKNIYDNNIRCYPGFFDFIESYLFGKNRTIINKSNINDNQYVDWASGSFLIILVEVYERVGGFDEHYFMYCEDLDLCRRIHSLTGEKIFYINEVKALHFAAHNNRRLFSKHFIWHLQSIIRYCLISKY